MNRLALVGAALALGLSGAGCVDRQAQAQAKKTEQLVSDPTKPIALAPVGVETISQTLEITGELTTDQDTQLAAKQSGKLVAVYVKDGDPVSAGQLVAAQDATALEAQVEANQATVQNAEAQLAQALTNAAQAPIKSRAAVASARAQLRSAQAQLQKTLAGDRPEQRRQAQAALASAKSNMDTQKKQLDRIRTLVTEGALAGSQLDTQESAYATALANYQNALESVNIEKNGSRPEDIAAARESVREAQENLQTALANQKLDQTYLDQVNAARAQVQSAMQQVRIAQQAVDDTRIRAPFAGTVSGKPLEVGAIVGPGTNILRIIGKAGTYFEGQVPEEQVAKVSVGKPVAVYIDALGKQTIPGVVAAVNPLGSSVGRSFTVRIRLQTTLPGIRPGMFARGDVELQRVPNATVVPQDAVVQLNGKSVVFTADGSKARSIPVTTGLQQGSKIEVKGVPEGTQIVVQGQQGLIDGSPVKVLPAATASGDSEPGGQGG